VYIPGLAAPVRSIRIGEAYDCQSMKIPTDIIPVRSRSTSKAL